MDKRWIGVVVVMVAAVAVAVLFACSTAPSSGEPNREVQKGALWTWFYTQQKPVNAVALVVHGRGQDPDELADIIATFNQLGVDVLRVQLIGHPQGPETTPGLAAWLDQVESAYDQAVQKASRPQGELPVFGVGYSFGGALLVRMIQQDTRPIVFDKLVLFAPAIAFTPELKKGLEILETVRQSADDRAVQRLQRMWGYIFSDLQETLDEEGEGGEGGEEGARSQESEQVDASERYKEFFASIPNRGKEAERFGRDLVAALKGDTAAWNKIRGNLPDALRPDLDQIMQLAPGSEQYQPFGEVLLAVDLALKQMADALPLGKARPLQKQPTLIFIDPEESLVSEQSIESDVIQKLNLSQNWRIEEVLGVGHRGIIQISDDPQMLQQLEQFVGISLPQQEDEDEEDGDEQQQEN
ncbi:MAG: alpha/beta fold hydrolase [Myxococcota bacterium]